MTDTISQKINPRWFALALMIGFVAIWRVIETNSQLSPLANFTPIGAMALFAGAQFKTALSRYLFPLAMLLLSDIALMLTAYKGFNEGGLYEGWYWVYLSFVVMVFVGERIANKVKAGSVVLAAVAAALAHYIITDFGVWLAGGLNISTGLPYTRDLDGLIACYVLALPFLKTMLSANLIYSAILFGGFALLQKNVPSLNREALA